MKKGILVALLLGAATHSAQAQISAGTKLFSGAVNYSRTSSKTDISRINTQGVEAKQQRFEFAPTVGYFVREDLAVGVTGTFLVTKKDEQTYIDPYTGYGTFSPEIRTRTLGAGAFARYYTFIGEKVALYGQAGAGYTNTYYPQGLAGPFANRNDTRAEGLTAHLFPGIVFFPTNKPGLELTVGGVAYSRTTINARNGNNGPDRKDTVSNFDFRFGLQDLNLGLSLYLGRN